MLEPEGSTFFLTTNSMPQFQLVAERFYLSYQYNDFQMLFTEKQYLLVKNICLRLIPGFDISLFGNKFWRHWDLIKNKNKKE